MKRNLLFIFYILLINNLLAQDNRLGLGVHSGVQFSNINDDGIYFQKKNNVLPTFGLIVELAPYEYFAYRAEINYTSKGFITPFLLADPQGEVIGAFDHRYRLDYVEVPLMLHANYQGFLKYYLNVGMYAAYLLSAKLNVLETVEADEVAFLKEDVANAFKSFDWGFVAEIGFSYRFASKFDLSVGGRYTRGMQAVNAYEFTQQQSLKNYAYVVHAGLIILLNNE